MVTTLAIQSHIEIGRGITGVIFQEHFGQLPLIIIMEE